MHTDADLAATRVDTLFVCDARGRLLGYREPWAAHDDLGPAPRCFLFVSPSGVTARMRADQPDALADTVARATLAQGAPLTVLERVTDALATCAPITKISRGPAYRLDELSAALAQTATRITAANAVLLAGEFDWLRQRPSAYLDTPAAGVIVDGRFVSICFCSRQTATAAEAGLDTAPAYRGRGYGAASAACWARGVASSGQTALYSTEWDNRASLAIARKLGAHQYGEDISIT
jgi:hypothetical protein